jgi:Flp pilus assembly CpaE family ATPase
VLTYDSMAIRNLVMAREAFDAIGYPPSKLTTVLNRSDSTGGLSKADVEASLGATIDFELVSDGRLVVAANNEGVPFVTGSPDAPISQGIRLLAESLSSDLRVRQPALARH